VLRVEKIREIPSEGGKRMVLGRGKKAELLSSGKARNQCRGLGMV